MKVTPETIAAIQAARTRLKLNQTQLAQRVGLDKTTISRLLSGQIHSMRPELVDMFNDKLGLDLQPLKVLDEQVSAAAVALSRLARENEPVAQLLENLLMLIRPENTPFLPDVPTARLEKIGAAVTRIVHLWEDHKDPHYAKIGAEVLDWLRKFYASNGWKR